MQLPRAKPLLRAGALASLAALASPSSASAQDFVVPSGSTVVYDTDTLPVARYFRFVIEQGATLRVVGDRPFSVVATEVRIDGLLDASGQDASGVLTLNTTNQPELGASGTAGGGAGGIGSGETNATTLAGGGGFGPYQMGVGPAVGGGEGGESSFALAFKDDRRGAGGGGGRLAADRPVVIGNPLDPANLGLVATPGFEGGPGGTGAVSQSGPARGGQPGAPLFQDATSDNDFWGFRLVGPAVVRGEVDRPEPGRGGGAGGDAIQSSFAPVLPFNPAGDEKGAGGGGGGALVAILARTIAIGPEGRISADGGDGGGGENTFFFDRVGGGSGGGSGGWIVLEATEFDLSGAGENALTALGGRGGVGRNNAFDVVGAGGNGGPGVIQLHTPSGTPLDIQPPAAGLTAVASPAPWVLLPALRP